MQQFLITTLRFVYIHARPMPSVLTKPRSWKRCQNSWLRSYSLSTHFSGTKTLRSDQLIITATFEGFPIPTQEQQLPETTLAAIGRTILDPGSRGLIQFAAPSKVSKDGNVAACGYLFVDEEVLNDYGISTGKLIKDHILCGN